VAPPPPDRDGDRVPDAEDACPDVPGVATNDPKTNGCPPDRDQDEIPDAQDACPDVRGVRTNDPVTNGCAPDRDRDGVADFEDACPDVKGVKTSDPKTNGCPPDRDADGIPDDVDACPDQPGKADPDPKKNGCPLVYVKSGQIRITQQVKFRFDSADLDPAGDPILEAVLQILRDHPEIKKVRVEGHTDNKGTAAYNKNLSVARARAVTGWLEKHGVARGRLTAEGFGMDRPIDTSGTEEAQRNNRRVEFHIVEGPSDVASP
jgi:outer membrane protein OmpA-like peptidoglycan-associated protein